MLTLLARVAAAARTAHPPAHRLLLQQCRQFPPATPHRPSVLNAIAQHRTISLGSIFGRKPPVPAPTPHLVAHITQLEAQANVNPHDAQKQLALFEALNETRYKSSYELIITRWERMCEFDPTSPLLSEPNAFQLYLIALNQTGRQSAIWSAVRRRDSLLAALPAAATVSPEVKEQGQEIVSKETTETAQEPQANEPPATPTAAPREAQTWTSTQIAERVLSGSTPAPGASGAPLTPLPPPGNNGGSEPRPAPFALGNQNEPLAVSIVERRGAWLPRFLKFIVIFGTSAFFFLVILSVFFESSGFMKAGPKQSQFEPAEGNLVKFSDVHGVDEAKEELQDIVQFLKDPASFSGLGGKLPKGVLLTGPPGTGKTMLARAVAGEAGVPFFFASGSDFEEMFVGVGAKRVRELFAAARKKEPAIIFIDELDAVGGKRSSRDQQYMKQTLNQLLVEMDGFQQHEAIIVIAATNFPESLDQALVRPGRFDRHVAVPLPDIKGRAQILQHHMRNVVADRDVDPRILARGTPGFSGADLSNMVNQAAIQASKERAKTVTLKHFEWAKDRIVMGAEMRSHYVDAKAKLATAYHEGGHALVCMYTEGAMPLHKVTCVRRGHALGHTAFLPENDRTSVTYKEYMASIDVAMGGRVAEELIYGTDNISSGASSDIRKATQTADAMVKQWGFSKLGPIYYDTRDTGISPKRREEMEDAITDMVKGGEARAKALLLSKMDELHRLANALVEHETLNADEVRKVIKGEPIRTISEILDEGLSDSQPNTTEEPSAPVTPTADKQ